MPEVSVVVPVRDGAETIGGLLESLAAQTFAAERFEVIVVDNASRDETARIAAERGATVVSEPRPSRAGARNRGVEAARAGHVAFIDGDCLADPGWLEALAAGLQHTPLAAGAVELLTGEAPNAVERFERLWRFDQERNVSESGWAASANLAIRREAFEVLGGFDTAYRQIGEDVDLCLRAARAGFALGWCPAARVSHRAETTVPALLRRGLRHGYSSNQHHHRLGAAAGHRYWRHPAPVVLGDWSLARFGVDVTTLTDDERRLMRRLGRGEYAARVCGSVWAGLARAR